MVCVWDWCVAFKNESSFVLYGVYNWCQCFLNRIGHWIRNVRFNGWTGGWYVLLKLKIIIKN